MALFYANEQFPIVTVRQLRRLGHDVLTTQEARQANQGIPDDRVLAYAQEQGRVVLTLNRKDFLRLHKQIPDHPGIVICTNNLNRIELAEIIHQTIQPVADFRGQLIRVVKPDRQQRRR
jgi:predicted nuclease of predicted toxin-antitoxin system